MLKNKLMLRYIIDCVLLIYCVVILYSVFKYAPDIACYECASFYLGVTAGLALAMFYLIALDIMKPIIKYIVAKIRKQKVTLIDILSNTK